MKDINCCVPSPVGKRLLTNLDKNDSTSSSSRLCSCRAEFLSDAPLEAVITFVEKNRTDGWRPFSLRTPFPYRFLDASHGQQTLQVCHFIRVLCQTGGGNSRYSA